MNFPYTIHMPMLKTDEGMASQVKCTIAGCGLSSSWVNGITYFGCAHIMDAHPEPGCTVGFQFAKVLWL